MASHTRPPDKSVQCIIIFAISQPEHIWWVLKIDLLNQTVLLKTQNSLFYLLIRETSQFLCYEICS